MKKRIIFAEDGTDVLDGLKGMLRGMRKEWIMVSAKRITEDG